MALIGRSNAEAARRSARTFSYDCVLRDTSGRSMWRARTKPSANSPSRRTPAGHAASSNTRASGARHTLALISDVPPSPHAIMTWISSPTRTSNSAVAEPTRPCAPLTCVSRLACTALSGKSPGRNSRPRSSTATFRPPPRQPRGRNAGAIAGPHHDHVVVRLELRSGHCQPRLHTPYVPSYSRLLPRGAAPFLVFTPRRPTSSRAA